MGEGQKPYINVLCVLQSLTRFSGIIFQAAA